MRFLKYLVLKVLHCCFQEIDYSLRTLCSAYTFFLNSKQTLIFLLYLLLLFSNYVNFYIVL